MGNCLSSEPRTASAQSSQTNNQDRTLNSSDNLSSLNGNGSRTVRLSTEEESKWNGIFEQGRRTIVDPEDVHTILESTMDDTINNLQPAEMTFILRRCRKVIGSFEKYSQNLPKSKKKAPLDPQSKSISIYQKEHLLDLTAMKAVFIAGDRWLSRGRDEDWIIKSLDHHLENDSGHKIKVNGKRENVPPVDLIGAAYTLLLHLSETRWDHVQAIAKGSAKEAGLNLDVNHQKAEEDKKMDKEIPKPALKNPCLQYELVEPTEPNGVTFQAVTYLIATMLRSSRKQRLTLLFHLLLGSKTIEALLREHPAGGVPSMILECNQDWSLSYASLSHEYYYDNLIEVDAMTAIETIGILLHYAPPPLGNSSENGHHGADSNGMNGSSPQANRRRVLSYGEKKYNAAKMHVMLTGYLRQLRSEKNLPVFEDDREQAWRKDLLDTFWKGSSDVFTSGKSWTREQFISWADDAIPDDAALDIIMHQMFGMGLLPTPAMERKLVADSWVDWQVREMIRSDGTGFNEYSDAISVMTNGIINLLSFSSRETDLSYSSASANVSDADFVIDGSAVWGGIGGFDGRGGLGHGIMYCVDKVWWDRWAAFVGWEWDGMERNDKSRSRKRPRALSSERLLDRSSDLLLGGTMGSYELMKQKLKKDVDYVLVPPCVWDILYELYAGGPPLPRMIVRRIADNASIDVSAREKVFKPIRIPRSINVETHPWVIECHVCDPHQPYRRGDVGPMSVRLMATADQPFWRLFAEIVLRFPIVHPRGKDSEDKGRGRLWKIVDEKDNGIDTESEAPSRYGPWELLMKGEAEFPVGENFDLDQDAYNTFTKSWDTYGNRESVSSVGLKDRSRIMFEYCLHGKDGKVTWPREAAAKAGIKQRDSAEDIEFRRTLRGLGPDGYLISDVKIIIGTVVDAMDSAGRWYQAEIADIECYNDSGDNSDTSSDTEEEQSIDEDGRPGEIRAVKIDFRDVGGHEEWILVGSDRLAVKNRFTLDSMKSMRLEEMDNTANGKSNGETKLGLVLRRHTAKEPTPFQLSNTICSFPGFGACGLTNLGNTCYANSAIQCISYLPILRSYLLSGQFKKYGDINKDNPLGTGGKLLEEVASLQQLMWSGKNGVRSPFKFRAQLSRALQQYTGAEQQDAQELLNDLLDALHEDSNKVVNKPYVEGLEDAWVENNNLSRVGEESWRRFLRRNRSIVANIGMGQVLNRVSCETCNYTNSKFDPFNMLSIPFPTLSDVVFKFLILRRATPLNCPKTLNLDKRKSVPNKSSAGRSPSEHLITEEYTITMSRLDDTNDLKEKLSESCGIELNSLRLFLVDDAEENTSSGQSNDIIQLSTFPEKEGPCLSLAKESLPSDFFSPSQVPTTVMAFESTLESLPVYVQNSEGNDTPESDNLASEDIDVLNITKDNLSCTDPSLLAKALSRSQWPISAKEITTGLRVDAIDHRGTWFPGTIVEVVKSSNGAKSSGAADASEKQAKFKVHFDNFSSKWDLTYSFAEFTKGSVQPLYSRSSRNKVFDFQVFHCTVDEPQNFFSYPFSVVCYLDWSIARAGAHILAQASRFLELIDLKDAEMSKIAKESRSAVSKAIQYLVEADIEYVHGKISSDANNKSFDGSSIVENLNDHLSSLTPNLPFEIVFCDIKNDADDDFEVERDFEFRVDQIIGNRMSARHGIALQWKRFGKSSLTLFSDPFASSSFAKPSPSSGKTGIKNEVDEKARYVKEGMRLGVCLDEFCKEQNLGENDCWRCPKCKDFRQGRQSMALWRLPDLLTFHLKRFNCSARYREKITTKVNFPLTGLNMSEWCDKESLLGSDSSFVYDLVGVVHHYGGMTGGHYVATCKVSSCSPQGNEEVEHNFNGAGVHAFGTKETVSQTATTWKLGRNKEKDSTSAQTRAAFSKAKTAAESSEPLWLQFDDDSVEPIPPRLVNAESAYVLFYRRRQIAPCSISKYTAMN